MYDMKIPRFHILLYAGIIIGFIAAYYPVLIKLVHTWSTSDDYSHGFFIVPIALYVTWQKREQLASILLKPSWWGGLLVVFTLALYFLSSYAGVQTVCSLTIVPLWAGIVLFLFGWSMVRALTFPLFLLFFMIPVPSQIYSSLTIPLQLIVTKISVTIAVIVGVPIFVEGNVIHLPERTLEVVEACSGLRSLVSLLMLSLVFAYFTLHSNVLRSVLFVSAIPVAIIVNITRVLAIVLAFYYFDFNLTTGSIHTWLGLIIFMLAVGIIAMEKGVLGIWDRINPSES
jgi:exosortase